ncbi:MAG: hemerythrin domain-containing protein [Methanomassiliicoccus sp.]|nr:hemerythrin domain-containing protein [Methanomassiliicoccus sp.]
MIEHRLIERMITVLDRQRVSVEAGSPPNHGLLDSAVDFMRTYADRCHHGKEEELLFAKLRAKSMVPEMVQAMDRLIADHVRSRALVGRLSELNDRSRGGDLPDGREISKVLGEIVTLYPDHIFREDKQFFPAAMKYLDKEESIALLGQFEEFDRKLIHEKYRAVVEGVERK